MSEPTTYSAKSIVYVKINRMFDFIERVGWTSVQAASGAAVVALTEGDLSWNGFAKMVGTAAAIAALKVVIAQRFGDTPSGDAIPGGSVIETPPRVELEAK